MGDLYKFTRDLVIKKDCDLNAIAIGALAANTITEVSEITNGWYNTQNGWVYAIYNMTTLVAVKVGTAGVVSEGSSVKLTMTTTTTGEAIPDTDTVFTVTEIATDGTSKITSGDTTYWVPTSSIVAYKTSTSNVSAEATEATVVKDTTHTVSATANSSSTNGGIISNTSSTQQALNGLRIQSLKGVFGMPYQYMSIADNRIDSGNEYSTFGRKYAEKIVARIPLLIMVPGTPQFMAGYNTTDKENLLSSLSDLSISGDMKTKLESLITKRGKYYSLSPNWKEYFNHVNPMCQTAARILNLEDKRYLGDTKLGDYRWENNSNEKIHDILNYKGGTAFYINSDTQIADSFSNGTGQSMIAGKVNGISDIGREMNFLLGGSSSTVGMNFDTFSQDKAVNRTQENKDNMIGSMLNGNGLISSITNGLNTVIAGGKLIFPEIWNDSQFSRDYSVHVKLVSPDCDDYSIYLNIIVPVLHLIGFVCPRSTGPNGYVSPFLVRAFYKGLFNCDMGIITNMSINKGQEGSWTASGLPTVVDVNFTIKELYGTMAITTYKSENDSLLSNITLMDYIGNLCGVNINETDLRRTAYFYYSQYVKTKYLSNVYQDVANSMDQWASNRMLNMFNRR